MPPRKRGKKGAAPATNKQQPPPPEPPGPDAPVQEQLRWLAEQESTCLRVLVTISEIHCSFDIHRYQ